MRLLSGDQLSLWRIEKMGVRTPKPLNQSTQNLAWVIMSAISLGMPQMQAIASLGKWVKYHSRGF